MRASSERVARPAVIGIDIGKDIFHLVAFTAAGEVAFRKKIKRLALAEALRKLPPVSERACRQPHRERPWP